MAKKLIGLWQPVSEETVEEFKNRVKEDLRKQGLVADRKSSRSNETTLPSDREADVEAFKRKVLRRP